MNHSKCSTVRASLIRLLGCASVLAIALLQPQSIAQAKNHTDDGQTTLSGDVTDCTPSNFAQGNGSIHGITSCMAVGSFSKPTSVTFDGNLSYDINVGDLTDQTLGSYFAGLAVLGGGEITVKGDYGISGLGAPVINSKYPMAAISSYYGLSSFKDNPDWHTTKIDIQGDLQVGGGMLFYQGGSHADDASNLQPSTDQYGSLTIGGTTTMDARSDDTAMFYNNGSAALVAPMIFNDTHADFNGSANFNLPLLSIKDPSGNQSVYGAIILAGPQSSLSFKKPSTYTLAQQYNPQLTGVINPSGVEGSVTPNYPAAYGWVMLSGVWDSAGTRGGLKPTADVDDVFGSTIANFNANYMTLNYTMDGDGPSGIWGVVSLNQHAHASLSNTTLNLNMQGSKDSRASVFLSGITPFSPAPQTNTADIPTVYFDNKFDLNNVNVNFNGTDSGKYVSLFDVDATIATVSVSGTSSLIASDNSAISDRSLIYINNTMKVKSDPRDAVKNYDGLDSAQLTFNATQTTLRGGIYVDDLDNKKAFTGKNLLNFTIDGSSTSWLGDLYVASEVTALHPDRFASATITIINGAIWTGDVTSNKNNVTLKLANGGIWSPLNDVTPDPFVAGKISLDGGIIHTLSQPLTISVPIELGINGGTFDTAGQPTTYSSTITGSGLLYKRGDGTLILDGQNKAPRIILQEGVLSVGSDDNLGGDPTHHLDLAGGTLQITGTTMHSTRSVINWGPTGGGFDIADAGNTFTIAQNLATGGALTKLGAGTLVLSGANAYTGGTNINAGTLSVSSDSNLGDPSGALNFSGGTLLITGDMNADRKVSLSSAGGTVSVDSAKTATFSGVIANADTAKGSFTKAGDGTLVLTASNTYTGGTTIAAGTLQLGDGTAGHDGMILGDIVNNSTLNVNNMNAAALSGAISGTGSVKQSGAGTLTLSGNNSYGDTHFNNGVLSVAQAANLGSGTLDFDGGTLQVTGKSFKATASTINWGAHGGGFDIADANNTFSVSSAFSGAGALTKTGAGGLILSADSSGYNGAVSVKAGDLRLDGATLGGTLAVDDKADLGGHGAISGAARFASGATLFGQSKQKLSFGNGLNLATGSQTDVTLTGGQSQNALFDVTGDLALNGTLNVESGSVMGTGVYRIFDYTGNLTENTMTLGTIADSNIADFNLQTAINHQVNLVNTAGRSMFFWDGAGPGNDGIIQGGNGTWDSAASNWTGADGLINSPWGNDGFAVFGGTGGTVTIDAGYQPSVNGMQFMSNGYVLQGSSLTLAGTGDQLIIVGDGSLQSSAMTATIHSDIEGNEGLLKSGAGQLVLNGANTYTGTTTVTEGLLTLGEGGSIDSTSGIVLASTRYGYGDFAVDKTTDTTLANQISGIGTVFKRGKATTTFSGDNSFSGGLTVEAGAAKAGIADNAFGSGHVKIADGARLDLANFNETIGGLDGLNPADGNGHDGNINLGSGTLTLNQDLHADFSGVISGTGGLTKNGKGDLVLYGANDYSGATALNEGALVQGAAGGFSAASTYNVASGASLELGGFSSTLAGLSNGGDVFFGGNGGSVLNVSGDYNGTGGTLHMSAVFGDDNSLTDRMNVTGNTSGSSKIDITNRHGFGAKTNNGIEIISVAGNSDGLFTLNGDYTTKEGKPGIMTDSAYAYTLQQGGTNTPNDGNWYLVSKMDKDNPAPPIDPSCETTNTCPPSPPSPPSPSGPDRYSPAAPVYESYTSTLQALNKLPTLQQRVGKRYLEGSDQANAGESDSQAIWGRIEGAHHRAENGSTAGDLRQEINTLIMQAGVDGQFYEDENGKLFAGITGQYGNARSDIDNRTGDGSGHISTQGWGLGATATWYGTSGFYLDAQAQANWYDSDLDVDARNQTLTNGNKGFGYALSLEAGQRFDMNQYWSLTPQAQLMWSSVDFDTFTDTYGARISNRNGENLTARLGLAANYTKSWKNHDGLMVNTSLYAIANLYQELMGDARMNYAGTHMVTDSDDTWGGIGVGTTYAWADNKYMLYGEGSIKTSLNHFSQSYALKGNVGFKVKW